MCSVKCNDSYLMRHRVMHDTFQCHTARAPILNVYTEYCLMSNRTISDSLYAGELELKMRSLIMQA